ncbi:MAG TPA: phosphotransferase [Ktedonobacterales bacterium]|jgi:Ser/Thr protein kinase RdoA (MazF antagonist)
MMNVQTMRHLVDVVEAGQMPAVAREAARLWAGEPGVASLAYVRASANFIFRFTREDQPCYLRLADASERDRAAIEAELDFIRHVGAAGVTIADPLPSTRGALLEELTSGGRRYCAVVFRGLPGREVELDELDEATLSEWGRTLAQLHNASNSFLAHRARPTWEDNAHAVLATVPPTETAVRGIIASGLEWLATQPRQDSGLIHGDFELDNLAWDGARVGVMDFDDAAYAWYAIDIAIAVQDIWREGGPRRDAWLDAFYAGYASARPVPTGMREAVPHLQTLLLAVKFARLLRAYANTNAENSPPWVVEMRGWHQTWLAERRAQLETLERGA